MNVHEEDLERALKPFGFCYQYGAARLFHELNGNTCVVSVFRNLAEGDVRLVQNTSPDGRYTALVSYSVFRDGVEIAVLRDRPLAEFLRNPAVHLDIKTQRPLANAFVSRMRRFFACD